MDFKRSLGKFKEVRLEKKINLNSIILRNEDIDDTDLDGEKVMMNLDKGQYFMMNEVGSRIWEIVSEPKTVKEVMLALLNEYEVEREKCEKTVIEFLSELVKSDLIKVQ